MAASHVAIRPAEPDDAPELQRLMLAAQRAEQSGGARPPAESDPGFEARWIEYLIRSGRGAGGQGTCWAAVDDNRRTVGFACVARRGSSLWLALLYVSPDRQRQGLGRRLLDQALMAAPGSSAQSMVTMVDAASTAAQGLYQRYGLRPQLPVLVLQGPTRRAAQPAALAAEADWQTVRAEVDRLDLNVLGYERSGDHQGYWQPAGFHFRLLRAEAGQAAGYGYWNPFGRLGPVVGNEPAHFPQLLQACLGTMSAEGHGQASLLVPAANATALAWLFSNGFTERGREVVYALGPSIDWRRCLPHRAALP